MKLLLVVVPDYMAFTYINTPWYRGNKLVLKKW